jgi:molybdate transport system substrate-binding protein
VVSGQAAFNQFGKTLNVTNSPGTIINWQAFSIARDEATRFVQQSAASAVLSSPRSAAPRPPSARPPAPHLESGAAFDVMVMTSASIDKLEKAGKFLPGTRRPLARTGIGIAMREGAPRPDLSTVESTRAVLLAARSISYSFSDTGGTSGGNSQQVLAKLGIADAVKTKLRPVQNDQGQAMIGAGEIEMGLYNVSEIPRAKGVVRAGALPASVQVYSSYDIAVPATNTDPAPALAYRDYLLDPAQRGGWENAGLEPAR